MERVNNMSDNNINNEKQYYKIPCYSMKCRLYPNKQAAKAIDNVIDGVRIAFNMALYDCVKNGRNLREADNGYHYVDFNKIIKADYLNELRKKNSKIKTNVPANALSGMCGCFNSDMKRMLAHRYEKKEYNTNNKGVQVRKRKKNKLNVDKNGNIKDLPIELAQINYYSKKKKRTSYTYQGTLGKNVIVKNITKDGTDYINNNVFYITLSKIVDENGKKIPIKVRGWNKDIRFGENQEMNFLEFAQKYKKRMFITVSKDNCGDYWIVFKLSDLVYKLCNKPNKDKIVGVDVGVKDTAILSDGTKYENNRYLKNSLIHKQCLCKQLSRRQGWKNIDFRDKAKNDKSMEPSKRYKNTLLKLAKLDRKIQWQRENYNNQISYDIVSNNSFIGVESLNVSGMFRNKYLARALSDVAMGQLLQMIQYKSVWYGRIEQPIGMWTPSSKECNVCGYIKKDLTLKDRFWECPVCHTYHDRDINAAINIKKYALSIFRNNKAA